MKQKFYQLIDGFFGGNYAKKIALLALFLGAACDLSPKYKKPQAAIGQNWWGEEFCEGTNGGKGSRGEPLQDGGGNGSQNEGVQNSAQCLAAKAKTPANKIAWRNFFVTPELKSIIELALKNNRDFRIAALNIDSAKEFYNITKSNSWLQLSSVHSYSKSRTPRNALLGFGGNFASTRSAIIVDSYKSNIVSASFELDLFGRLRSTNKAAFEDFLSKIEERNALKISLIAESANAYLQWVASEEALMAAQQIAKNQEGIFALQKKSYEQGLASRIEFSEAEATLNEARSALALAQKNARQNKNALLNLLALKDEKDLPQLAALGGIEILSDVDAKEIPSEVLLTRPDIVQAEHQLRARNADIGAARAAFFPSFSITGSNGFASTQSSNLFSSGSRAAWSYSPQISIPIFSGGRANANLKSAKVDKEIAVENYQKAIQTAFREVSDELAEKKSIAKQNEAAREVLGAREKIYQLNYQMSQQGSVGKIEALNSHNQFLLAQIDAAEIQKQFLMNRINLYKVLGGGLEEE